MISAHSAFSPSSSEVWLKCSKSAKLAEEAKEKYGDFSTSHAERGVALHEIMEDKFDELLTLHKENRIAEVTSSFFNGILSEIETIMLLDQLQSFFTFVDIKNFKNPKCQIYTEQRVVIGRVGSLESFGTVDLLVIDTDNNLHVLDYKFGNSKVEAKENTQLILYAIGCLNFIEGQKLLNSALNFKIEKILLHILQPKNSELQTWKMPKAIIPQYKKIVKQQMKHYRDGTGDYFFGGHCQGFAKCSSVCEKFRKEKNQNLKFN